MSSVNLPDNILVLGFLFIGLTGLCVLIDRTQGRPFLHRFNLHIYRKLSSGTPSRAISPDSKSSANAVSQTSYAEILPPQRRQVLANLKVEGVLYREVDDKEIYEHILPMTTDYRTCDDQHYTPTGFSVSEIKALGDFPDYAALSGVPLPQPYPEFNIDKALPRPYRPFRWAYHQTMCMVPLLSRRVYLGFPINKTRGG